MGQKNECMIFCDPVLNGTDALCHLVTYHAYRIMGERNPDFDRNSRNILDFKECKQHAIDWAFELINPKLAKNCAISFVPSHDAGKIDSPLKVLVKLLVNAERTRIDASDCLIRNKTIPKLAHGGERSIQVHLNSIRVENSFIIEDKQVLVLDDVQTTGNSLKACIYLMEKSGIRIVRGFSIAKTAGY